MAAGSRIGSKLCRNVVAVVRARDLEGGTNPDVEPIVEGFTGDGLVNYCIGIVGAGMNHGVLLVQRRETDRLVELAQLVEDRGFDLLGLNDSQAIFRELYVTIGVGAEALFKVAH